MSRKIFNSPSRRAFLRGAASVAMLPFGASGAWAQSGAQLPQQAPRPPRPTFLPGRDYDQILEQGFIEIGVYEDFPPFSFSQDGKLVGIDVDLAHLIAEALGVRAQVRSTAADENVDGDLRNNIWRGPVVGGKVVNVLMHVPYDRELETRNELIVLTGKYMGEKIGMAWRRDAYPDGAPTVAYFRYDTVGAEVDSLASFYLANAFHGQVAPNLRHYPDTLAAMQALESGEVKAVLGPLSQLEFAAARASDPDLLEVATPVLPGLALGAWTLGVAVRHNYRQLGYAVDDAMRAAIEDGRMAQIFARYGVSYRAPDR
ncbi:MAG: transporter substrate-binding domain-containing protein [Neomegalonema sp.]|nr:transporter substrate-binding domain-containing protein [Neomegalonema sp.]